MQKDETLQLKGLAILMMLWLHLFSNVEMVEQCNYLFPFLNGKPLVYTLTRIASSCVPIYIFLGGYGLCMTYRNAHNNRMHNGQRALSLMVNFWIVCLIFIPLGCVVNPERYPRDLPTLILNVTGISYSYNGAWWFLLPYVMLTLCSAPIIRFFHAGSRRRDMISLVLLLAVHITAYTAKDMLSISDASPWHIIICGIDFLFMLFFFSVGILFVKYQLMEKARQWLGRFPYWALLSTLLLLCIVKMCLGASSLINLPFVLLAVPLFLSIRRTQRMAQALRFWGRHSTNMWLVHYFYSHYIFGDAIYALRYPVVIYLCLVTLSVCSSWIVQKIFAPIKSAIRKQG